MMVAGLSALAYLLSTLILFLAALSKSYKEESYGHGWSGGKNVTDLQKWHLLDSTGPGKTVLIICFVIITVFFVIATIHNLIVFAKGTVAADRSLPFRVIIIGLAVVIGILAIVGIAMFPYDFESGRSYSSSTQCYGSAGCYSYGAGRKYEWNGIWLLILALLWAGELALCVMSFTNLKIDMGK